MLKYVSKGVHVRYNLATTRVMSEVEVKQVGLGTDKRAEVRYSCTKGQAGKRIRQLLNSSTSNAGTGLRHRPISGLIWPSHHNGLVSLEICSAARNSILRVPVKVNLESKRNRLAVCMYSNMKSYQIPLILVIEYEIVAMRRVQIDRGFVKY